MRLVFRAYDDGVAFRYVIPEQRGIGGADGAEEPASDGQRAQREQVRVMAVASAIQPVRARAASASAVGRTRRVLSRPPAISTQKGSSRPPIAATAAPTLVPFESS